MQTEQFDAITALQYDSWSNSIIAFGNFVGTCDFGNVSISSTSSDYQDVFIAKIDLDGNCIWAKHAGSSDMDRPNSMSVDNEGNIYVCAMLPYSGSFGSFQVQNGGHLAKYDPEGNVVWVKKIFSNPNPGMSFPLFIGQSKIVNGSLYLTGYNTSSTFTIDTITYSKPGYYGHLIANFDLLGNIQWLNCIGGPQSTDIIYDIDHDAQNNIYFAGYFDGEFATFDTDTIFANNEKVMYVAKYKSTGEKIWIKPINATLGIKGTGVNFGNDDYLYVTGSFNGIMNLVSFVMSSVSNQDIFILKMDQEGNFIGSDHTNGGVGYFIHQDMNGLLNLYGGLLYTANFGGLILTEQGQGGWYDIFVAQHAPISHVGVTEKLPTSHNDLLIYANPSTGICNISIPEELQNENNLTLLVYDNAGKLILQQSINMQEEKISLNLQAEAKGVYNAILSNGKQKFQGKVVFE